MRLPDFLRDAARGVAFEIRTKVRLVPLLTLLCAVGVFVPLTVWRNVSYGAEELDRNVSLLAVIERDLEARARADPAGDAAGELAAVRDQLAADSFDRYRTTTPGSVEAALGLAAGLGGPAIGLLIAAILLGGEYRQRTLFHLLSGGRSRTSVVAWKLLAVPLFALVAVLTLTAAGAATGMAFNARYRQDALFSVGQVAFGHLAAILLVALLLLTVWGWIAVTLSFVVRSSLVAVTALATVLGLDAFLSVRVGGVTEYLLTMRFAQLAAPFWPPPTRNTIDTFGYLWWVSTGGERFPNQALAAAGIVAALMTVLTVAANQRFRRLDLTSEP